MSGQSVFVDRESELNRLRNGLEEGRFYTVVGSSGHGKSALLHEFADDCESQDIPVVEYEIQEPESIYVFLQRFLEQWDEEFPGTVFDSLQEKVSPSTIDKITRTVGSIDPSGGIASKSVGMVLRSVFENEEISAELDPITFALEVIESDAAEEDWIVVIIENYEPERLEDSVAEHLDGKFREISSSLPDNVTWYLEAGRKIPRSSTDIYQVSLEELEFEDVKELVVKRQGFPPDDDTLGEVYNRTKGHPYFLNKLLTLAERKGLENALINSPTESREFNRYIEENVLNLIGTEKEQFLRDVCVLPRIYPHIAGEVADVSTAKARQIASDLQGRAILRRKESAWNEPYYLQHDLQRDYLLENEPLAEQSRKRFDAASSYLSHTGELSRTLDADTPEDENRYLRLSGYMEQFDAIVKTLLDRHGYEIEEVIRKLLERIENPGRGEDAIKLYYSHYSSHTEVHIDSILAAIEE